MPFFHAEPAAADGSKDCKVEVTETATELTGEDLGEASTYIEDASGKRYEVCIRVRR